MSTLLRCEFGSRRWLVSKRAGFNQDEIHTYIIYWTLNHSDTMVDTLRASKNGMMTNMSRFVEQTGPLAGPWVVMTLRTDLKHTLYL